MERTYEHELDFIWGTDYEFGIDGWRPDIPGFNVVDARGMVHDFLEHATDDGGSTEEEFRALGAVLYGRVFTGEIGRMDYSAERVLAGDIISSCRGHEDVVEMEDYIYRPVLDTHPDTADELDGDEEEFLAGIAKWLRADMEGEGVHLTDDDIENLLNWMRHGYHAAEAKYRSRNALGTLFHSMTREIENNHEYGEFGETLTLAIDFDTLDFEITRTTDYEDY